MGRYVHKHFKCACCLSDICTEEITDSHIYTSFREFDEQKRLVYVKQSFSKYCGDVIRAVKDRVKKIMHLKDVDKILGEKLIKDFPCPHHGCSAHKDVFVECVLRFLIELALHWFAKTLSSEIREEESKSAQKIARLRRITTARLKIVRKSMHLLRNRHSRRFQIN